MLFVRKTKNQKRKTFAVPAFNRKAVKEIVEKAVAENSPGKSIAKIKKTKLYIQARLDGSSKKEAKALAGYTGSEKQLLQSPVGQTILETLLATDFSDQIIVNRLKEMWNEGDVIKNKKGEVMYERKNHDVRKFAFDRVLELRKLKNKDDDGNKNAVPTTIVFQVQPLPPMPKSAVDGAIDVTAESADTK